MTGAPTQLFTVWKALAGLTGQRRYVGSYQRLSSAKAAANRQCGYGLTTWVTDRATGERLHVGRPPEPRASRTTTKGARS